MRFRFKKIMDTFDVGPGAALAILIAIAAVLVAAVLYFIHSAPPTKIVISSGPEGSIFQKQALRYAKILKENGVKLEVVTSAGSMENLQRLKDPRSGVDLAMVQGGNDATGTEDLISLGSISHQPLLIFYRGKLNLLSDLQGKKIAIGPTGSGTNAIALTILRANKIKPGGATVFLDWDSAEATRALKEKKIDAAFVMSESASVSDLKTLMRDPSIHLYSFKQVEAYSRKYDYLDPLVLPEGALDLGTDLPKHDVQLIGPMVELVAKKDLHPAVSDLILEAATRIHSHPGLFQQRNEFPAPIEHSIRISDDASRYYKSGKSFLYRYLPYWLASLLSRIFVVFVPAIIVLIPIIRLIPAFLRWKVQLRIYQRYRDLLNLEHRFARAKDPAKREALRAEFDRIESEVNQMRIKGRFADQLYNLRGHISYVRARVEALSKSQS